MSKRSCRTTENQYKVLITFMEDHPRFGSGQLVGQLGREMKIKLASKLEHDLNSDPRGPAKSWQKWNTVWNDWKSNTRKKAAGILKYSLATGGGGKCTKELSPLEERLLLFLGPMAVTGDIELPEGGLPAPTLPPPPAAGNTAMPPGLPPSRASEQAGRPSPSAPWTPDGNATFIPQRSIEQPSAGNTNSPNIDQLPLNPVAVPLTKNMKRSGTVVHEAPAAKRASAEPAEDHRTQAAIRLANMAESSAQGLKLTAIIADALTSMEKSMSRMADSLESLDSTTKNIFNNVRAMAAKIQLVQKMNKIVK